MENPNINLKLEFSADLSFNDQGSLTLFLNQGSHPLIFGHINFDDLIAPSLIELKDDPEQLEIFIKSVKI